MYWWEGKVCTDTEILLMLKTQSSLIPELTSWVKENHPYTTPEVISAELGGGNDAYYKWIQDSTKTSS